MLSLIRESKNIIKEDETKNGSYTIYRNDSQFGDVRVAQEETFIKTVGENVEFDEKALVYYPKKENGQDDLVLTGKINSLGVAFEFRYNDPSGDGCYIWANSLQLTDTNNNTLGKIRDAFVNWKKTLLEDGDLLDRLKKVSTKQ